MKKGQIIKPFDPNDKATNDWLNSQKPSTRANYSGGFRKVMKFTGMNGDQILASRQADVKAKTAMWEKKLLQLRQWVKDQGKSDLHARQTTVALRSFFAFHRVKLEPTPQEATKLRKASRKTEDFRFSREDLHRMAEVGKIEEKYIVIVGKSFGMRAGDFLKLTRGHFSSVDLTQPPPIFLGEYATQKESVPAYPFIDSDAVQIVRDMLKKMDREGRTDPNEKMLKYKNQVELSRVLKRLAKETGIEHGNKVIRFHGLRKFLSDKLSQFMSDSKWKQIVGKSISESAYISADSLREDYARAMAETTFAKTVSEKEVELMAAQKALEMLVNTSLSMPSDVKEAMLKKIRAVRKVEELRPLEIEVGAIKKQERSEAGGLNFEQMAAKSIARMFKMAMRELKEMNEKDSAEK